MSTINRRYDIDWVRVIAIGLLLVYHVAIGFQSWGVMIGFITNDKPWASLWIPMAMMNVWRIPLLFFVSGMGVCFAMRTRNWKQLLLERAGRILVPFLFGMLVVFPASVYLWQRYYQFELNYNPHPGHLWFLGNLFAYVLILFPLFFYLKRNEDSMVVEWIKKILSHPLGLLIVFSAFIAEVMLMNPRPYEMYAMTWHGFILGLLAFFFGFCFTLAGRGFNDMIVKWRWVFVVTALTLFTVRMIYFKLNVPGYLLVIESDCWIFSVLAFAGKYLDHPTKALTYLSKAAYPVYILHMIFLFLGSSLIFPLDLPPSVKFILLLLFTVAGCFAAYEVIRKTIVLRPFFGIKADYPRWLQFRWLRLRSATGRSAGG